MNPCAFCGRVNDAASRYCIDCGKPMSASAARVPPAVGPLTSPQPAASGALAGVGAGGGAAATGGMAGHGGGVMPAARLSSPAGVSGAAVAAEAAVAPAAAASHTGTHATAPCPHCGTMVGAPPASGAARSVPPTLALLNDAGDPAHLYPIERGELIVGRADGDIRFPDDVYLSPIHALFAVREGGLWLRDLGSRNGSWVFGEKPFRLTDGDVILVGSQLLRFRRLGYPGPHPPEADATRRLGSLVPNADVAMLQQLRADGSVRDTLHLSPGRNVVLGRDTGDWVFPYDQTMSGRHAEVRSEDSEFVVHDQGSRNGVALATRGERKLERGTRVLLGDQILRVESL